MAKPNLIVYAYFFIFLPFTSSESGSGLETSIGYGACVDDEQENSFNCFTQMPVFESIFIICDATGTEMNLNETKANFSVSHTVSQLHDQNHHNASSEACNDYSFLSMRFYSSFQTTVYATQPRRCVMKNHLVGNCSIDSIDLIGDLHVCLTITLTNPCKNCQKLKAVHIVKPEAPFGLNITYQEKANEYLVQFSTPHVANAFLENKLIHQLAYRQENTDWTTTESNFVRLKLLGKEFEPEVTYEMKIRSRPNGKYYKGYWSDWSSSQYFKTSARTSRGIKLRFLSSDKVVLITVSIVSFFVLFVVILLVPIFWKNRIKAIVWPTIPNHKKTLDKFCNKLRKNSDASFFNPESLGYVDIHKVESIQAKSEVAHLQPPSYNLDAETEDLVEPKSNLNHIHHGWLKLPLAYEGMWSTEVKDKLYGGSEVTSDDHSLLSINLYNEGRIADQHGWNSNDLCKYSIVLMDHIFPPELKAGSCDHTYSNGETRVLNKEETYVTMASFFEHKGL